MYKRQSCIIALATSFISNNSQILFKNRGGILQPSKGLNYICKTNESVFRKYLKSIHWGKHDALIDSMTKYVSKKCVGKDISLPVRNFLKQESEYSHFLLVIKAICQKYFKSKLFPYCKTFNEKYRKIKYRFI